MKRMIVAIDVPDDHTKHDVADTASDLGGNPTAWEPSEFGADIADHVAGIFPPGGYDQVVDAVVIGLTDRYEEVDPRNQRRST